MRSVRYTVWKVHKVKKKGIQKSTLRYVSVLS